MVETEPIGEVDIAGLQASSYKALRQGKKTLELARRTARETRLTFALAVLAVGLLIVTISLLWSVLEHLPKI